MVQRFFYAGLRVMRPDLIGLYPHYYFQQIKFDAPKTNMV